MARRTQVLLFDGDCGFCTSVARWARRRLPPSASVLPWQVVPDLSVFGLTGRQTARHAYWVDAEGRTHRGHLAVAETLRAMGPLWRAIGTAARIPPISWVAEVVYELVSRLRHHLPGGTPACRLPR